MRVNEGVPEDVSDIVTDGVPVLVDVCERVCDCDADIVTDWLALTDWLPEPVGLLDTPCDRVAVCVGVAVLD